MSDDAKDESEEIIVEVEPEIARGLYSNLVLVTRTRTEIALDFAYLQPNNRAVVQARIVLVPENARHLIDLLRAQLESFAEPPAAGE